MFNVGEYVVYGSKGVCKIIELTQMKMPGAQDERLYYVMHPVWDEGARVYLPADSEKAVIRTVITKQEAENLIREIPAIKGLPVPNDKKRELEYKEAMRSCDCRLLVSVIKTLVSRRADRLAAGKKNTALDERYLRAAEHELFDELAIALGKDKDTVTEEMRSILGTV